MLYELFCHSVQGAGHIKHGTPCQDYGLKFQSEECKIFILGDGHGDSNCPRSDIGSRTLCEIALEELKVFAAELKRQDLSDELMDKYGASELVNQLVISIFGKWSCAVNEHFSSNPLTEQEEAQASVMAPVYKRGERIEHIYGTTFIAGLMTEDYLLLLQQGDGRCVVFDAEGNVSQPIPWDDRCFSNVTTSVCDTDAVQSCRYHIIDLKQNPIIACVLGSDGVEDSFASMDLMHCYYRGELLFAAENGVEAFEERMKETLPELSKSGHPVLSQFGSQDDVTVCGVIDRAAVNSMAHRFREEDNKAAIRGALARIQERIRSMKSGKMDYLRQRCADADAEYNNLNTRYTKLKEDVRHIEEDIENQVQSGLGKIIGLLLLSPASLKCLRGGLGKIKEDLDAVSKELQDALAKKQACDDEYNAYIQRYEEFLRAREEYEGMLRAIEGGEPASASDKEPEAGQTNGSCDTQEAETVEEATPVTEEAAVTEGETAMGEGTNEESTPDAATVSDKNVENTESDGSDNNPISISVHVDERE